MQEFLRKDFAKILKHNGLEGRRLMRERESTVIRVYDRSLDGLDITVDLYGPYARILDYSDSPLSDSEIEEVIDIVNRYLYIEKDKIIYKERKKREGREQHEKADESLIVEVKENSLYFKTELLKYVDTGLFLDQEETRRVVKDSALGLKILNLFSYTASFSVYAASGGAESVESVDLSNVYTNWARENLDQNGFYDREKYPTIAEDAFSYVNRSIDEKKRYDLIIFDPPSFSNSHKAVDFDLKKDYLYYLFSFTKLLTDKGVVIFSENLSSFNLDKGALKPYYKVNEVTNELRAFGFTKKKSSLRIFRLEKVKEYKGKIMKRIQDDESLKSLSLEGDKKEKRERREKKEEKKERWDKRGTFSSDDRPRRSYGIEKGSYRSDRNRDFDDRKRGRDESRDGYRKGSEDRPRREYKDGPRREYDRPRNYEDRPRRGDREFDEKWFDRQNRRFDDEKRRDQDRPRRDGDVRRRDGEDRRRERERGEGKPRVRKAPVPYGYDEFRATRTRDKKERKDD